MIGDCRAACAASDLAADSAGVDSERCATHLRETAALIIHVETLLQHHFLPAEPAVPVFADPTPAPTTTPDAAADPSPTANSESPDPAESAASATAVPPSPPPVVLPPADPILCTLTTPAEISLLVHEIRGIRSVFVLGAELDLKPTESENLFKAAAQMTRRLEPLIRDFFAKLGGSAETGELKVES
ncbi:MAG: hypothetical protein J0M24_18920 [Verrucomicrobia bacterium]|nr:hypothetical protein [Verrucomicrobiota bacterium]